MGRVLRIAVCVVVPLLIMMVLISCAQRTGQGQAGPSPSVTALDNPLESPADPALNPTSGPSPVSTASPRMRKRGIVVKDREYRNLFFDFAIYLPKGWTFYSLAKKSRQPNPENPDVNPIFVVFEKTSEEAAQNANIRFITEKLSGEKATRIKTGKDYLVIARENLNQQAKSKVLGDIYEKNIGGVPFSVMDTEAITGGKDLRSSTYVALQKDYILVFILTDTGYPDDTTMQKMKKSLETMKFNVSEEK